MSVMVARLILRTFAGGEARLTWQSLPPPRKEGSAGVPRVKTVVVKEIKLLQEKGGESSLVNSSDSEEGRLAGVSGFGLIPRATVFGLNARRQVKRLAAVLDGLAEKPSDVIFFTGTLPGSTRDSMLALSQWSGFVVHRLKAWIHDQDARYKCLFCWEWQKRGALHLHMAVYVGSNETRRRIYEGFKQKWIDLLDDVCNRSGIDVFKRSGGRGTWRGHFDKIRARAEWVSKGVGAYLGKYLSKAVKPGGESAKLFFPSRWWGSTQNLKDLEKASRTVDEHFYSSTGQAEGAYNGVVELVGLLSDWSAEYRHKVMPGATTVACNATVPLLRKMVIRGSTMRAILPDSGLREANDEFVALLWYLHNEDSDWFAGVSADFSVIQTFQKRSTGLDATTDMVPDTMVLLLNAAAHMLNHAATAGKIYRAKRLHPREVISIRQTYRRVMIAVERYLELKYAHSLRDVEYPGKPIEQ